MNSQIKDILAICNRFRNIILQVKDETKMFQNFPIGCCRDTSLILGMYLEEIGFRNLIYCNREIDQNYKSHAWLLYGDLIIDITADQFGDEFPSVIVNGKFNHVLYSNHKSCEFDISIGSSDLPFLFNDYKKIKAKL
jgi:hypothetical protein